MNNIKKLRKERKLTQIELAQMCHITQGTLSGYETGRYEPDMETLKMMANIFSVPVDDIIGYVPTELESQAPEGVDAELWAIRESVRRDPERRELFNLARHADIEQVRQAVAIIDALKKASGGGNDENP